MSDPLAIFFTQPLEVRRYLGDGANGPVWAAKVTLYGRIKELNRLVVNDQGDEAVSSTRISMSITEDDIPTGSKVRRVGDELWHTVIAEARHIGGFAASPDYYSIDLA